MAGRSVGAWRRRRVIAVALASLVAPAMLAAPVSAAKPASGTWSGPVAISPALQPDPTRGSQIHDVAVNAGGTTIAAWDQFSYTGSGGSTIGAAVQTAGKWGTPFTVSATGGYSTTPRVAVGADGTLAVSWIYQDSSVTTPAPQEKVQVAVRPAGSTTWTTSDLATYAMGGTQGTGQTVPIGIDARGNLTAAWSAWDGTRHTIRAASWTAAAGWGAPATITPTGFDGLWPALSVNARGDAALVYTASPWAYGTMPAATYSFRSGPGGTWSSQAAPWTGGAGMVELDGNGRATLVARPAGLEASRQLPDGSFTTPVTAIPSPIAGGSWVSTDLAMDANGNALVVAAIFDATVNVDRSTVWVSRGSPTGAWTTPVRLTDPTVPIDAYAAQAAVSPDGGLMLAGWIDHYHGTVQVARWSGGAWTTTTIGRGTAFSSFQEVLALDASSSAVARATWKNTKGGTTIYATGFK